MLTHCFFSDFICSRSIYRQPESQHRGIEVTAMQPMESLDALRPRAQSYFEMAYAGYRFHHSAALEAGFKDRQEADSALMRLTGFSYGPHLKSGDKLIDLNGKEVIYYESPEDRRRIFEEQSREREKQLVLRKAADRYMELVYQRHYDGEKAAQECGFANRHEADVFLVELTGAPFSAEVQSGTMLRDVGGRDFRYYSTCAEELEVYRQLAKTDSHYRFLAMHLEPHVYAERNGFVFVDDLPPFQDDDIARNDLLNRIPEGGTLRVDIFANLPSRPMNTGDYRKAQGGLFFRPGSHLDGDIWHRVDRAGAENPTYAFLDGVPVPIRSATSPGDMQPILVASADSPLPDRIFTEKGAELPKVPHLPGWYFNTRHDAIHYDSKKNQISLQA